ncbi:MAG: elongation factor G [Clostridia bacterium]|nr:elongation factor G [Clostridia bacterium]
MAVFETKQIRNVALLGHGGSGKTSLTEAMLYIAKCIDRLGKTPDGNTTSDYDAEEIKRGYSISATVSDMVWGDAKINVIDTPGYLGFVGEEMQGVRVADSAIIVLDGKAGVEVGTELAWDYAIDIPKAFFINKCDDPEADFDRVFKGLHAKFGNALCPVFIPVRSGNTVVMVDLMDMKAYEYAADGSRKEVPMNVDFATLASQYKDAFNEAIAQTSDDLLDKYFNGEEITHDEAAEALHTGIINGSIVPVYCGSSTKMWGVRALLDAIDHSFPRHTAKKTEKIASDDGFAPFDIDPEGPTALFVFKTVVDPFVGKMSFFKVMNGSLKKDITLKNTTSGAAEKIAKIYTLRGKKQTEVAELACGDIGMLAKLNATGTCDTLTNAGEIKFAPVNYPEPNMCMALAPQAKGDEDKISQGITKLLEEDLTVKFENNAETKQMLIYGMGDIHLDVIVSKLKSRFGTSVKLDTPIIPYRETITKSVEVEGKYKKQTGGHGQYGHVKIRFAPGDGDDALVFTESTVGGSVPKNFHPAVEKGLQEAMLKGVAGFPVVNIKADLFDGSYHDVDSSEMSFKLAAGIAFKECMKQAKPVLLEPVGALKVTIPDAVVGDVMGDLNKRRGRVMGMEAAEKKAYTVIDAEVPRAEMMDYTISLRAMTQGRGKFTFNPLRYEEMPAANAQKIIDAYKGDDE